MGVCYCYVLEARELEDGTQTLLAWSIIQQDRGNYTIFFLFQLCILRMNLQDKKMQAGNLISTAQHHTLRHGGKEYRHSDMPQNGTFIFLTVAFKKKCTCYI